MTKMRNYTFVAGCIAMAKKGQVGRELWQPSPLAAEPKEAALGCFGDIRRETMEREGLTGSAKGTRIMDGVFVERWVSRKKTKKLAANETCAGVLRRAVNASFLLEFVRQKTSAESGYESISQRLRSANLASPNAAANAWSNGVSAVVPVLNAHHLIVATNSWLAWRGLGAFTDGFQATHESVIPSCRLYACIRL